MSRNNRLPPKKDVALALLENSTVFLHLDPRREEVKVPPWFKKQPQLVLQIGLNMTIPIPDLTVDENGVSCTLSFNRSPFFCHVPWVAVYALVGEDQRGMIWPEDVPPEVTAQIQPQAAEVKPQPRLRAVEPSSAPTEPAPAAASPADAADEPAPELAQHKKKPRKKAQKPRVAAPARREAARPARPVLAPVQAVTPRAKSESSKESSDGSKKKRELPPYLRVVK